MKLSNTVGRENVLTLAASTGRTDLVEELLNLNPRLNVHGLFESSKDLINTPNFHLQTALHIAVKRQQPDLVRVLINNGSDPSLSDMHGMTPLMVACKWVKPEKYGVKKNEKVASEIVNILLRTQNCGVNSQITSDISKTNVSNYSRAVHASKIAVGRTALSFAAEAGYLNIVKKLIEKGAKVEIGKEDGWYPLTYAVYRGHLEIVKANLAKSCLILPNLSGGDKTENIYRFGIRNFSSGWS